MKLLSHVVLTASCLISALMWVQSARGAPGESKTSDAAAVKPLALLYLYAQDEGLDPLYAEALKKAGYQVVRARYFDPIDPAFLKRFDSFIIERIPYAGREYDVFSHEMIHFWRTWNAVIQCVKSGAGVLIYANIVDNGGAWAAGWNQRMQPWGIQLRQTCVVDEAAKVSPWVTFGQGWYTWTEKLASIPTGMSPFHS